jgi:hypothetical protein
MWACQTAKLTANGRDTGGKPGFPRKTISFKVFDSIANGRRRTLVGRTSDLRVGCSNPFGVRPIRAACGHQLSAVGIKARVETEMLGFDFPDFDSAWTALAGVTTAHLRARRGPRHFRNLTQFIIGQESA